MFLQSFLDRNLSIILEQWWESCDHSFVEFLCELNRLEHPRLCPLLHLQMGLKRKREKFIITFVVSDESENYVADDEIDKNY